LAGQRKWGCWGRAVHGGLAMDMFASRMCIMNKLDITRYNLDIIAGYKERDIEWISIVDNYG
jgi:hypothetical protein